MTEATVEGGDPPKLPSFHAKHVAPLEGLLYIGRLEKTFTWAGHSFKIRTITSDDRLRIGQVIKPWMGTSEETRAWLIGQVGACIVLVDGQNPRPAPLGVADDNPVDTGWVWAKEQFSWTIDAISAHLFDLEALVEQVIDAMGKASGLQAPSTPTSGIPSA